MGAKRIKVDARKKAEVGQKKGPEIAPVKLDGFEGVKLWFELHQRHLMIGALAVLVILGAVWGIESYLKAAERRAQSAYATVFDTIPPDGAEASAWEPVLPALDKFLSDYSGSRVAWNARTDKARALYELKRYDEAFDTARKLLADLPADSDLKPFVLYRLAVISQARGNADEALDYWMRLKTEGYDGFRREADWNLGKLFEKKGDLAKATEHLQQSLTDPGGYPAAPQIQEALDAVKRKSGAGAPKTEAPKADGAKTDASPAPKPGS